MYHRVKAESSLFSAFFRLTYGVICGRGVIRRGDSEKNADREQNLITREAYSFLSFFVFYANTVYANVQYYTQCKDIGVVPLFYHVHLLSHIGSFNEYSWPSSRVLSFSSLF